MKRQIVDFNFNNLHFGYIIFHFVFIFIIEVECGSIEPSNITHPED